MWVPVESYAGWPGLGLSVALHPSVQVIDRAERQHCHLEVLSPIVLWRGPWNSDTVSMEVYPTALLSPLIKSHSSSDQGFPMPLPGVLDCVTPLPRLQLSVLQQVTRAAGGSMWCQVLKCFKP